MDRYMSVGLAILICFLSNIALCQEPIVFPAKGQGQEQMEQDKYSCYTWAKQQTGFDPMKASAPAKPSSAPKSSALRGAAGGAAVGAAAGAIAGDAGKGAAIGAASGGMIGGVRARREREQEAQTQQAQADAYDQSRGTYYRAFGACMKGKGYSVE